jgi:uncharacterized protein (TIGR03382 family)
MVLRAIVSSSALAFAACLAFGATALADVPPPDGYEESCTVERQQRPSETCEACRDSYHGDVDACERRYTAAGYTFRCRTPGASVWTELWCRDGAAPTTPPPVVPPPTPPVAPPSAPEGSAAPSEGSAPTAVVPPAVPSAAPSAAPTEAPAPAAPTAVAAPDAPAAPAAPVDETRRGCAAAGGPPCALAPMFAALALVLARRRRT